MGCGTRDVLRQESAPALLEWPRAGNLVSLVQTPKARAVEPMFALSTDFICGEPSSELRSGVGNQGCRSFLMLYSRKGAAVSRALWFPRLPSLYSGVYRYLILVGLRSGSVRIRSQICQQLEKLWSLADEKSVVSESGGCAHRSARGLGRPNNRTNWEASI
jgi:hypothetical protein